MTQVRLTVTMNDVAMRLSFRDPQFSTPILCAYPHLRSWQRTRPFINYTDWVMDSGAFSVKHSGMAFDNTAYIRTAKNLLATDTTLSEVFALDVHMDPKATLRNTEAAWDAGVKAIPCFHMGEPEWALKAMAQYPKVALGGIARTGGKDGGKWRWAEQCFARLWPKKIHGFGLAVEDALMRLPWHSVDCSSWIQPLAFGGFRVGNTKLPNGYHYKPTRDHWDMTNEVRFYHELEMKAKAKWAKEMKELDALPA